MSFSRGVHYINPELDKNGGEFRTGRRQFSANKNQSQGLIYQQDDSRDYRPRAGYTPQQDYGSYSPMKPESDPSVTPFDSRSNEELMRLREAIRQKDEELRALTEQPYSPPVYAKPPLSDFEAAPLSRNSNLVEFERAKRDDQRRRTAEALAYQMSEKQRVKEMERQAREIETVERLESLRRMQEEEYQRKMDMKLKANEYRRMLDIQAQSKAKQNYPEKGYRQEFTGSVPLRDATNNGERLHSYAQNAASFYGDDVQESYVPAQPVMTQGYAQPVMTQGYAQPVMTQGYAQPVMSQGYAQPTNGRRAGRNYKDTSQLIG